MVCLKAHIKSMLRICVREHSNMYKYPTLPNEPARKSSRTINCSLRTVRCRHEKNVKDNVETRNAKKRKKSSKPYLVQEDEIISMDCLEISLKDSDSSLSGTEEDGFVEFSPAKILEVAPNRFDLEVRSCKFIYFQKFKAQFLSWIWDF